MVSDARRGATALVTLKRLNTYAYMYDRQNAAARLRYITLAELNSPTGRIMFEDLTRTGFDLRSVLGPLGRAASHPCVAILYGDVDAIGEITAPEIRALFPAASVHVIARSGHYPWIEQPRDFYAALDSAFGQCH